MQHYGWAGKFNEIRRDLILSGIPWLSEYYDSSTILSCNLSESLSDFWIWTEVQYKGNYLLELNFLNGMLQLWLSTVA